MLTIESLNADRPLYVFLAIEFAEKALPAWEAEYPEDMRPRKAIEAAKEWLKNPSDASASAASASYAITHYAAARAARDAANDIANAAATAAARAAYAAAHVAHAAHYAAAYAAIALEADKETFVHEVILENIDWILQYKVDNVQSFNQPELIFDYLDEEKKQSFLFNLDRVA